MNISPFLTFMLFSPLLFISAPLQGQGSWLQKGNSIYGEAANDLSGSTVSMPDINTVAVGAPLNASGGIVKGHVRVYHMVNDVWVQKGVDLDGLAVSDNFGVSVSMPDANTVAVGADGHDGNYTNDGMVRVFRWNGSVWLQKGIDLWGSAINDNFGFSVSMPNPNTLAVGANGNSTNGTNSGQVKIYRWNGSAWIQKGASINGEAAGDESGWALSMPDTNTVAIAAPFNDGNGPNSGHVRVYTWSGTGWVQKGSDLDGIAADDEFGYSVNMPDANTIAIGGVKNDSSGINSGHARIFTWGGSSWVLKGQDIFGQSSGDFCGFSVSMPNPDCVAVGASRSSTNFTNAGNARIFNWSGSAWVQMGSDLNGPTYANQFGWDLSMPKPQILAVGAPYNSLTGVYAGMVQTYCFQDYETVTATACNGYMTPSGIMRTTSKTYYDTLTNQVDCDSIIVTNLTIIPVDTSTSISGDTIKANASNALYQWLDCDDGFKKIPNEIMPTFIAKKNGNYAVMVTKNRCTDTSACVSVSHIELTELDLLTDIEIYPNPTSGSFTINFGEQLKDLEITLTNSLGQPLHSQFLEEGRNVNLSITEKPGVYFIQIRSFAGATTQVKVIKHP